MSTSTTLSWPARITLISLCLCLQACGETEETEITCLTGIEKKGGIFWVQPAYKAGKTAESDIIQTDAAGLCDLITKTATRAGFKVTKQTDLKILVDGAIAIGILNGGDFNTHYKMETRKRS